MTELELREARNYQASIDETARRTGCTPQSQRVYYGWRDGGGAAHARVHLPGGRVGDLPLRLDLANHSPDGFEWGYGGSGPSQLALAILADCCGDETAMEHYQEFKSAFIALLPRNGSRCDSWRIKQEEIVAWLATKKRTSDVAASEALERR